MGSFASQVYRRLPLRRQVLTAWRRLGAPPGALRFYFDGPFKVRVDADHNFLMHQQNRWGIETSIFWKGLEHGWEPRSVAAWIELCRDAQVILDVGAAEGLYALIARCLRPSARVMAFEPFPPRRRELLRNVQANTYDIDCPDTAISNFQGNAEFFCDDEGSHMGTLVESGRRWADKINLQVPVTTLAQIARDHELDRIDLIKLDVEGAEPEALEGLGPFLSRFRPAILVEVLDDATGERVEAQLDGLGYVYLDVEDREPLGPRPLVRRPHIRKGAHLNWLAVSEEQARRLEDWAAVR